MLYSKKQRPDSYLYFSQYKAFVIKKKLSAKLVEKVYLVRKKSVKKKYEITV